MFSESELAVIRRAYAKQILAAFRVDDERVEAAFAQVRREHYLGPGPWSMLRYEDYVLTPDADPVHLYVNTLVGIIPERKLNNGEPAFHALLIAAAAPAPGEHVLHIGAGTGYYTAILAHLSWAPREESQPLNSTQDLPSRRQKTSSPIRASRSYTATAPKRLSIPQTLFTLMPVQPVRWTHGLMR